MMIKRILHMIVLFMVLLSKGRSDPGSNDVDSYPDPLSDSVSVNDTTGKDVNGEDIVNDETDNYREMNQNKSEENGTNGYTTDRLVGIDSTEFLIENDNKNFENNQMEVDSIMEVIGSDMNAKSREAKSPVNEEMKDVEIISKGEAIELLDSELAKEGTSFPDVAANKMLVLLDNDIEKFEEMKKKVGLLEEKMKKHEHLHRQGAVLGKIVGHIRASEMILSTLTPFEENLEAVKEYIINLDHPLDSITEDFVTKFVVRADNFLKKAQQSLEIGQNENDDEKQNSHDSTTVESVENKIKEGGEIESEHSNKNNSQVKSSFNSMDALKENDDENSTYEPTIQSSMNEGDSRKEGKVEPSRPHSLTQTIEAHNGTQGIDEVKVISDDKIDPTQLKGSIDDVKDVIEGDHFHKYNPKFGNLFAKEKIHQHDPENIENDSHRNTQHHAQDNIENEAHENINPPTQDNIENDAPENTGHHSEENIRSEGKVRT